MIISRVFPRLVARVRGDRALEFLHAVLTQDVKSMAKGESALACYLDEKGHVLAEVRVAVDDDGLVTLDAEEPAREAIEQLARIAPLSECEIEISDGTMTSVRGSDAERAVEGLRSLPDAWGGFDVLGDADVAASAASDEDWSRTRIESGRPLYGVDVTRESILNETPLLSRAVSFTKGCYPGQETVARISNLGQRRKRLVRLRGSDDRRPEGVTSWARTGDGWIALATVRAELEGSAELDGIPVTIEAID